ncbi:DNA phosphorothioation-dependent restriction protein DptG [Weissella paramesenteroides]|uniref:Dnd system-associated protein 1 n=1 Tax=Weissella paramesenteroides ATCC 33313 TaxID=585506 RepID=C5R8U2_WEIPA|nr:DNA phosphorothioation-dependent restriction protein DptG [Weissella paramesenteroides]ATF40626.1 DNA phosphorothioation-dependent restriction protein DptG [Weissella paramesenteroides]EER75364.1 dnd system-associated protein 1 [Weissella paramesenteroides ATCC 33313]
MNSAVKDLIDFLKLNPEKQYIKYMHKFGYTLLPFFTREPERYKFEEEFLEVTGIIARISKGNKPELSDLNQKFIENLRKTVEVPDNISDNQLLEIFQTAFKNTKRSQLIPYISISDSKDKKGKIQVANLLVQLLDLENNKDWLNYLSGQNANNLYSQVLKDSLPALEIQDTNKEKFTLINANYYKSLFTEDFHILMESGNFDFISLNINKLFSFYYLIYIVYTGSSILDRNENNKRYYFAYEKEQVSRSRYAVTDGYHEVKELSADILVDIDIMHYLNVLSGNFIINNPETYSSEKKLAELLSLDSKELLTLLQNLQSFKGIYSQTISHDYIKNNISVETDIQNELVKEINELKEWLKMDESLETQKRYRKSYDEIKQLNYLKSRGSLGNVLNASQEIILLFTAIVVGNNEHLLLRRVFEGFEHHGLFFDKTSKNEIVKFYEEVNLLEKMSDSGDAQYVKSIL